jgi:choline dehydrogenase-like flavoprotein
MSRVPVETLDTEVLVVGSGAGGATTAAMLAEAGRTVLVVEEGPWVDPDEVEPFSLQEMERKYRHHGSSATLGSPPVAYAEGCCVGGSTEINSGLWHRLPGELAEAWGRRIDGFEPATLDRYASLVEGWQSVGYTPVAPPVSSALLERGATKLGWRSVEFPRVFRYGEGDRAVKQTMARTLVPRAVAAGATVQPGVRVQRLVRSGDRIVAARARRVRPGGGADDIRIRCEHVVVCGGAVQTPALLQRSGFRGPIGRGLKLHPTVKVAARFPHPIDHGDVPMHRIVEFAPNLTIGGSASRRGHVALAVADCDAELAGRLEDWEHLSVYYAAIRSDAGGRVLAVPGLRDPVVSYRITDGDLSRLARGLVHLGEALLAAGATELYPSVIGAPVVHDLDGLAAWWSTVDRRRANLMTVHLTSSVRMGIDADTCGTDSYGRVHGTANLRVNDASLLPDAPGVNPQATIMTIAARNADAFLAGS